MKSYRCDFFSKILLIFIGFLDFYWFLLIFWILLMFDDFYWFLLIFSDFLKFDDFRNFDIFRDFKINLTFLIFLKFWYFLRILTFLKYWSFWKFWNLKSVTRGGLDFYRKNIFRRNFNLKIFDTCFMSITSCLDFPTFWNVQLRFFVFSFTSFRDERTDIKHRTSHLLNI